MHVLARSVAASRQQDGLEDTDGRNRLEIDSYDLLSEAKGSYPFAKAFFKGSYPFLKAFFKGSYPFVKAFYHPFFCKENLVLKRAPPRNSYKKGIFCTRLALKTALEGNQ